MPRAKNKIRKIGTTPPEKMKEAVLQVIENKVSIRNASETYLIPFPTLRRYVEKYKYSANPADVVFEPKYNCKRVFSDAEKIMLKDYFIKASKIHYGLSPKSARELAYQYAIRLNKSFPPNWEEKNVQVKIGSLVF